MIKYYVWQHIQSNKYIPNSKSNTGMTEFTYWPSDISYFSSPEEAEYFFKAYAYNYSFKKEDFNLVEINFPNSTKC